MKVGDLIMIGDSALIIIASKWRERENGWYWAIAPIDDPSDKTGFPKI